MVEVEDVKKFVNNLSVDQTVTLLAIMESEVGREDLHSLCLCKKQEQEDPSED